WVFISGAPLYDAQGRVIGSIGIHADITARKKTEEALRQAEEKYHAIFEHAMIGIFQTTPDGRFLTANPAIARMLGYASADELIRSRTDIARQGYVDSQRREEYKRLIEQHGSVMGFEYEVYCKDGSTIWISEDSRAVRDAHGKLLYFEGYFVDIKERKLAEAALLQQSAYFRQLFESSPSAIVLRDKYGNVLDVNAAFTNMFQFTPEEVQGRSLVNLIVPAERKEEVEELAKRRSRGEIIQLETVRKRKDGSLVEVALTAYPIVIEGEQVGVFTIYVDASERKRLEEQLRQSQKLESLGTLAGGIAHDFNNILGIILGHITLLERMPSDPGKVAASTKAITQASHRGASLVQQLLTFARKADVLVESVRVNEIVREIEKLLKETFPKIIDVKFQLGEGLPSIAADATQVHQVILNLCVNARDAMLPAGGTLTITTGLVPGEHVQQKLPAAENKTYLDLSISDTGTGIDEATRSRIFEPFFTTKELGKGTGLGLSTVYGIVQYHGGEIDVETVLGKGTTFHVYFPIHTTVEKRDESIEESTDEAPGGTETILLVEDEDMLRELATIVLQMKGYTVLTARDGDEGLNVFQQHRNTIALVLSDMGLPKLGGYDMFKEMKKLNPGLRAVLASGYIEPGVKSDIFNAGVIDFIQKPFKPAVLLNKIRRALDLGK
ncbi:MAG TPA: PAS domain S-box protein, partial [Bacteroidota bacterium]